jgi:CheY-like chemotaxis protein
MSPNEPTMREHGADPGNGSVSAREALEGLAIGGAPRLSAVRLNAVVGATLRAAVDLLLGEQPSRRSLRVSFDDGALDLVLPEIELDHLTSAAALLETVDGSLGPAREGRAFLVRVPVAAQRPLYLMLEQGTLGLAVPWHAVIRIRLAAREALERLARREACPVLPPFVSVPVPAAERPAVLVGLGLRRAFLVADRLVWRMPADPAPTPDGVSAAGLESAVRTADGEVFRVADPVRLLRGVDPPPLPSPPRERPTMSSPPRPAHAGASPAAPPAPAPARILELRPEDVEPLGETAPSAPPAVPGREQPVPEPRPGRKPRRERRALVVEDSIVGRIFLQRLLEAEGYAVESLASASELRHALGLQSWSLLFVDVALPDSPRGEHLKTLSSMPTVALVRDAVDETIATAIGVRHRLRKPFERRDLLRVLETLRSGTEAP